MLPRLLCTKRVGFDSGEILIIFSLMFLSFKAVPGVNCTKGGRALFLLSLLEKSASEHALSEEAPCLSF